MTIEYNGVVSELGIDEALAATGVTSTYRKLRKEREARRVSPEAKAFTFWGHEHPRLHDFLAIYLLDNEGWKQGIVVGERKLIFRRASAPDVIKTEQMMQLGAIPICVGQGPFSKVVKVTSEHSVTRNTARFLGILDNPVYKALIEWSHTVEGRGPGSYTETAGVIRLLSLAQLDDPANVYGIVEQMIDACRAEIIEEQRAEKELHGGLRRLEARCRGKTITVGGVISDAPMIARMARRKFGVDVLVCKNPTTGHGLVTATAGISLANSVAYLRREEAKLVGLNGYDDRWVYKRERTESIINGGWTAPDLPATAMDIITLATLVQMGLEGV